MDRAAIFEKTKALIVDQFKIDADKVVEEAAFIDDLNADSLDIVDLVMALEDEFGVSIPDEDAESIKTVGDAVSYIESNQ